jgi:hypothetical protein
MGDDLLVRHLFRARSIKMLEPARPGLAGFGFDCFVAHARFESVFACILLLELTNH